ncbi:AAA family ATPase [Magnetospirillum molischianum]|uniref:AAA+ ATPase domain-containing protein n=1 Tax=Magnetospirillum molischianum DSM 120 TaxID=1150626 RepID=H8FWV6_MAGML|nr:AAA family ATPase [Magnetospirillum molischianum]CCG42844.1 hypothetical protein PHAMO_490007 [Magnetospirillum molischianum DSM 120]
MYKFLTKHQPSSLDQIIFPDMATELKFSSYVDGYGFDHILMHGPHGTGKSTLARLLPKLIASDLKDGDFMFFDAAKDGSATRFRELADSFFATTAWNDTGYKFFVIDEADSLSAEAKRLLRGIFDRANGNTMIMVTSNDLSKIDPGIVDRCKVFNFSCSEPTYQLYRAQQILQAEGVDIPEAVLFDFIKVHGHSIRELMRSLEDIVQAIRSKDQPAPQA